MDPWILHGHNSYIEISIKNISKIKDEEIFQTYFTCWIQRLFDSYFLSFNV